MESDSLRKKTIWEIRIDMFHKWSSIIRMKMYLSTLDPTQKTILIMQGRNE